MMRIEMLSRPWAFVFLAAMAVAAGCVHNRGDQGDASAEKEVYHEELAAAPQMLLQSAEDHFSKGNLTMAHSQAERVYRMQPRNFHVLYLLARIALEKKEAADAEQWAFKALESLQPQYLSEKSQMWDFIAHCRREQGAMDAADEAMRESAKLRRK